ncbi:MAG: hypothetical protein ABW110_00060 [Steroidobacteraceae bacterium]
MDRRSRTLWTFAILVFLPAANALSDESHRCSSSNVEYEIVEIGDGSPVAINDHGQLTGTTSVSDEMERSFVWHCATGMQDIGALSATDPAVIAYDINNRGEVVGQNFTAGWEETLPFIWDRVNGMRAINTESGIGYEVNDWGDVALIEGPASVWNASTGMRSFSDVTGVEVWQFPRINNLRQVGGMMIATEGARFFLWGPLSGVRDLGPVPQSAARVAPEVTHMNELGDLVGTLPLEAATLPFMVNRRGELELLAEFSEGRTASSLRVNNHRQVVGLLSEGAGATSFVWDPSNGLRPFAEVLAGSPDAAKYSFTGAIDINDRGWMAGHVVRKSDQSGAGALFIPIPKNSRSLRRISELSGRQLCHALRKARNRC